MLVLKLICWSEYGAIEAKVESPHFLHVRVSRLCNDADGLTEVDFDGLQFGERPITWVGML